MDAAAVTALTRPSRPYSGTHRVQIDITCVMPQAVMKIANAQNTQPNSTSGRLETKIASANGIEK